MAEFLRAVFALVLTLGLIGVTAYALRRWGPGALLTFGAPKKDRRLTVIESLVLDPARRLVLVSCDGKERLLLLGDGQFVAHDAPPKGRG